MIVSDLVRAGVVGRRRDARASTGSIELWQLGLAGLSDRRGGGVLPPLLHRLCCRASCPSASCWPPTASRACCGRWRSSPPGPAIGGIAVALLSPGAAILIDGATFLVSAALLARSASAAPPSATAAEAAALRAALADLREGGRLRPPHPVAVGDAGVRDARGAGADRADRRAHPVRGAASASTVAPPSTASCLTAFGIGAAAGALGISWGRMPRRYLTVMLLVWGLGDAAGGGDRARQRALADGGGDGRSSGSARGSAT